MGAPLKQRRGFKAPQSLWQRLKAKTQALWWWIVGRRLDRRLADTASPIRTEAEEAVAKVVYETDIPPDCVVANVVRGGPCILIKHDDAWEAFVHNSYMEAAEKAIEWLNLQGDLVSATETSNLNRKQRRIFNSKRRKHRGGRKAGETRH